MFDIAVNGEYLDYDKKARLCDRFGLAMVPCLYRGPFSRAVLEQLTDGPTTVCDPKTPGDSRAGKGSWSRRSGNASPTCSRGGASSRACRQTISIARTPRTTRT